MKISFILGTLIVTALVFAAPATDVEASKLDAAGDSSTRTYEFYIPADMELVTSGKLHVYAWDDGGTYSNAGWPGLTEDITYDEKTNVATVVVKNADADHLIINNGSGGKQTENIWLPGHIDNLERTFGDDIFDQGNEPRWAIRNSDGSFQYYLQAPSFTPNYGPDQFRFWLDRGADESGYYIYAYEGDDGLMHHLFPTGYANKKDNAYLAYYDIPIEAYGKNYSIWWTDDKMGTVLKTEEHQWVGIDNAKLHNIVKDGSTMTLNERTLATNEITAEFFGNNVLSAYFTCLPSEANGYLAASELRKNWVTPDDQTWYIVGNMHEVTLNDYAVSPTPVENYEEYYASAEKAYETDTLQKLNAMLALENNHGTSSAGAIRPFFEGNGSTEVIVSIALVSLSVLGLFGLFSYRKRTAQ